MLNKSLLSYINFFLLLIAVFIRTHNSYYFSTGWWDKLIQHTHTMAVVKGYGLGLMLANPDDISKVVFQADGRFAPAYPLFSSVFQHFTENMHYTDVLLDLLAFCLFFFSWRSILRKLEVATHPLLLSATLLVWAFSTSPFKFIYLTDFHSLAIYSWAISLLMTQIIDFEILNNKSKIYGAMGLGVVCFLCSLFRFSYYAQTFVLPSIYVALGVWFDRKFLKYGLMSFASTVFCILLLLAYQHSISLLNFNEARYAVQLQRGFRLYFENLFCFANIVWHSFFPDLFWNIQMYLENRIRFPDGWWLRETTFSIYFTVLFITLVGLSSYYVIRKELKNCQNKVFQNPLLLFYFIGFATIAVNFLFMMALSVYYPSEIEIPDSRFWNDPGVSHWTFVEEIRYFNPSILFFQLFLMIIVFYRKKAYHFLARILAGSIFLVWLGYMWVIWYYPFLWNVYSISDYRENINAVKILLYEDLSKRYANYSIVATSESRQLLNLCGAAGLSVMPPNVFLSEMQKGKLKTSVPCKLIIVENTTNEGKRIYKADSPEMKNSVEKLKLMYAYQKITTYYERKSMGKTDIDLYVFEIVP